jgi:hypothetical protein
MNHKARIALIVGILSGYLGSLILPHKENSIDAASKEKHLVLDKEIASLKETNVRLEQELKMLKTQIWGVNLNDAESANSSTHSISENSNTLDDKEMGESEPSDQ